MGKKFMRLHSASVHSQSLDCNNRHLNKTIEKCLNSISVLVSQNHKQPMDSLERAITVLFYVYKSIQCHSIIRTTHIQELFKIILLKLRNYCLLLFPKMIRADRDAYVDTLCNMFAAHTKTTTLKLMLEQVLQYARTKFSNAKELVTMQFGIRIIYMVRDPTLEESGFYLDETLKRKLSVDMLRGALLDNYLKYNESGNEFDVENCMSSMVFLLSHAQYLVAAGKDASFMNEMLATIFSKMENKFAKSASEIEQIKDWVTKILEDILGGSYTSEVHEEFHKTISVESKRISQTLVTLRKAMQITDAENTIIERFIYEFDHGSTAYHCYLIDGRPIVMTENRQLMNAQKIKIVLKEVLNFPYDVKDRVAFADILIFLTCSQRAILEEEAGKFDDETWQCYLQKLETRYQDDMSGNKEFTDFTKQIFFGQMVENMSLFPDAAKEQQNKIEAKSVHTANETSYIWCCNGNNYNVRRKIGSIDGPALDDQSIKYEVYLVLSQIRSLVLAQLHAVRSHLETLIKFMLVLMQKVEESEKVAAVEEFIVRLQEIMADKAGSWSDTIMQLLEKAILALKQLPTTKVEGDIFEETNNLLWGDAKTDFFQSD
ncbi:hypothetical protein Ciccas_012835 [Cichlidogyrus casuarinus]|uniref:Uncharacterized protein n=1 Tax=Cichlidogyrus casuarinus TaxID=1844966 RepID=A0ABD2PMR0_9PLAT